MAVRLRFPFVGICRIRLDSGHRKLYNLDTWKIRRIGRAGSPFAAARGGCGNVFWREEKWPIAENAARRLTIM